MKFKYHLLIPLLWLSMIGSTVPAEAQELAVHHVQDLDWGDQIFPGIEVFIAPIDPEAAAFEISGEAGKQVQLRFMLPDHLQSPNGRELPILFPSSGAGYYHSSKNKGSATLFDPKSEVITSLNAEGKLYLWLGAMLMPHRSQQGASYSASVTLDVSYIN